TRRTPLSLAARLGRLALLGAGTAAVAAPQLLPTLLLIRSTPRAAAIVGESAAFTLRAPLRLVLPGVAITDTIPAFFGAAALGLCAIAMLGRQPRATLRMIAAAIAFLASLGSEGGVHQWLRRIPPFEYFRSPVKLFALAEFAVAWTAALGLDALWRMPHPRWRAAALLLAVV